MKRRNTTMADTKEMAMLLTQYEKYGSVGKEEYRQLLKDEVILPLFDDFGINTFVERYNAFADDSETAERFLTDEDLDEVLSSYSPTEILGMSFHGTYNHGLHWHRIDGDGTLSSFQEFEVVNEIKDCDKFLYYLVEMAYKEDLATETIEEANKLIKLGY